MKFVKTFLEMLIYPIIPKICIYCKEPLEYNEEYYICKSCYRKIKFVDGLICKKCGLPLSDGGAHCYNCRTKEKTRKWWVENVRGAVEYKEPVKTLIHELKYNNKLHLSNLFAFLLLKNFKKNFDMVDNIEIICPVPMLGIKKIFRGYNQAEFIAKRFVKLLQEQFGDKIKFFPNLIKRKKFTVSQFKLSRDERLKNVKDVFEIKDKDCVRDKTILIIDDVCTTGETINQCAKVLINSGAKKVFGYVVARDV
jgi:ComF family protein